MKQDRSNNLLENKKGKFYNEKLRNFYSSPVIIRVMGLAKHVARTKLEVRRNFK
jgi:hypothetical protein